MGNPENQHRGAHGRAEPPEVVLVCGRSCGQSGEHHDRSVHSARDPLSSSEEEPLDANPHGRSPSATVRIACEPRADGTARDHPTARLTEVERLLGLASARTLLRSGSRCATGTVPLANTAGCATNICSLLLMSAA